jgi:hypothetical protein
MGGRFLSLVMSFVWRKKATKYIKNSVVVIGIFKRHNPFGRTMALGSTQPRTEMSIRNISWMGGGVKAAGA